MFKSELFGLFGLNKNRFANPVFRNLTTAGFRCGVIFLCLFAVVMILPTEVLAAPRGITYSLALSRAISRDSVVAPLEREIRQANAQARHLMDDYLAVVNSDRDLADEIYGQRLRALAERDRLQRDLDRHSLNIELTLRGYLADIAESEANIVILEANLDFQKQMLEQTMLRHSLGMASDMDLREAEQQLGQTALNLEMLGLSLENLRQQLNRLIHQPITANVQVMYEKEEFGPLPELTDREMQRLFASDHNYSYWREEVEYRRHEWQRQLDAPDVVRDMLRLEHRLSTLERDMARRQAELNVRNTLTQWDYLLEEELVIQSDIYLARANLEDMQRRYEAGLVIQMHVEGTKLSLMAQEARMVRHEYDFWITRLRIDRPYIR